MSLAEMRGDRGWGAEGNEKKRRNTDNERRP